MTTYALRRPCPKCPFRNDVEPYIRPERATEIARSIQAGGSFPCHQTTVPDPDDDAELIEGPDSKACAGALGIQLRSGHPNQVTRIAMRLGLLDPDSIDTTKVPANFAEWTRRFTPDEVGEPCEEAGPGCEAPAGWMECGEVVENPGPFPTDECESCGVPVCGACMEDHVEECVV